MATYVFKLPDVGEGIAEAEIVAWHVKLGDTVKEDQPLADVMTDKATVEISAPIAGKVTALAGGLGTKAKVGAALVTFETGKAEATKPAARKSPAVEPSDPTSSTPQRGTHGKGLASPAVRARAKALGIALDTVEGSGHGGRIAHEDLDKLLLKRGGAAPPPIAVPKGGEEINIFGLRRKIAERMQDANRRIPHFTYVEEVDVTILEVRREKLNSEAEAGRPRLTVLPFLIRALIKCIADHPGVNAHFDDAAGVIHRYSEVNMGIATQTPRGLLVPVIHHAEKLDLWQLAAEILRLSEEARAGKSKREELTGSTITVTSLGALGGIAATPIINPPEVAIVGVNRIAERAMAIDGKVTIRKMMNLSSSFDHRIVDGYDAAAFINAVKRELESRTS